MRVLGISSAERLPDLDAPTLREQGVDVEFENWRSLVAPPGVTQRDRRRLEAAVAAMVQSPVWRDALVRYRWSDRYLAGEAFARFTDSEEARVRDILRKLGTGGATTATLSLRRAVSDARAGRPGAHGAGRRAAAAFRAHAPAADSVRAGWKADRAHRRGRRASTSCSLERAGFVIASAALFWLTARAFDPEHPARDAAFALGVSIGAYLLFARALQLTLPRACSRAGSSGVLRRRRTQRAQRS